MSFEQLILALFGFNVKTERNDWSNIHTSPYDVMVTEPPLRVYAQAENTQA